MQQRSVQETIKVIEYLRQAEADTGRSTKAIQRKVLGYLTAEQVIEVVTAIYHPLGMTQEDKADLLAVSRER